MKQIIKLAELNSALVAANSELRDAKQAKDRDRVDSAKYQVELAEAAYSKHSGSKAFTKECAKYTIGQVEAGLAAAGYDSAICDIVEAVHHDQELESKWK